MIRAAQASSAIQWGDFPTWALAVIALLALIAAVLAYRKQADAARKRDMDDSTKRLPRASRLPQAALDHADKIIAELPPLTPAQKADLSAILYSGRSTSAAA